MADTSLEQEFGAPELRFIPEQLVRSGSKVEIPLYEYSVLPKNENLEFSIQDFPEGLTINPKTGLVTGIAPTTELNQSFLVSVTLTNLETGKYTQSMFRLEILGSLLLDLSLIHI